MTIPEEAPLVERPDRTTPGWVPWAIGASIVLVLVGALAVLAAFLGGDDPDSSATETDPASAGGEAPPSAAVEDLTRTLSVTAPPAAPPSVDLDGQRVTYRPRHMLDGVPDTVWRTAGDATGATVTFSLPGASSVRRVGIINGNARQVSTGADVVDWYPQNRRITRVEWVFDDGTAVQQDLSEKTKLQRLTIEPVTTTSVQLRVLAVTAPGAGQLGRDFTAISDVLIAGTPAG